MDFHNFLITYCVIFFIHDSLDVIKVDAGFVGTSFSEEYPERRLITVQSSFGVADRYSPPRLNKNEPSRRRSGIEEVAKPSPVPGASHFQPSISSSSNKDIPSINSPPVTFPYRKSNDTSVEPKRNLTSPLSSLLLSSSRKKNEAFSLPTSSSGSRRRPPRPSRRRQQSGGRGDRGGGGGFPIRIRRAGSSSEQSSDRRRYRRTPDRSFQSSSTQSTRQLLQIPSLLNFPQIPRSPSSSSRTSSHYSKYPTQTPQTSRHNQAIHSSANPLANSNGMSPYVASLASIHAEKSSQMSPVHTRHSQSHLVGIEPRLHFLKKKPATVPHYMSPYHIPINPVFKVNQNQPTATSYPYPVQVDRSLEKDRYEEAERLASFNALSSKVSKLEDDIYELKMSHAINHVLEQTDESKSIEVKKMLNYISNNEWTPIINSQRVLNHLEVTTNTTISEETPAKEVKEEEEELEAQESNTSSDNKDDHDDLVLSTSSSVSHDNDNSSNDGLRETRSSIQETFLSRSSSKKKPTTTSSNNNSSNKLRFAKKHKTQFQPDFVVTDSSS